jgi:hypothetical protein
VQRREIQNINLLPNCCLKFSQHIVIQKYYLSFLLPVEKYRENPKSADETPFKEDSATDQASSLLGLFKQCDPGNGPFLQTVHLASGIIFTTIPSITARSVSPVKCIK